MNVDEFARHQLDLLRLELQVAIEIEHTTLPPYLTAALSIHPDANRDAQGIIRAVAMQEMLHMTLAANVLNAVDGQPAVDKPGFIPGYPTNLPWHAPGFSVGLERFSPQQIDVFRQIEAPTAEPPWVGCPALGALDQHADGDTLVAALDAHAGDRPPRARGYHTIGEFYEAVILRLDWCVRVLGEKVVFRGDPSRQVRPQHYYGGGGNIIEVYDRKSAVKALWTIVRQGEGTSTSVWDGSPERAMPLQPAHFYSYDELLKGRSYRVGDKPGHPTGAPLPVDWEAVYPMRPNPKRQEYQHAPEIFAKLSAFDDVYFRLLHRLHLALNGEPDRFQAAVAEMYELRYRAVELMRIPDPRDPGRTVGPSWGSLPAGTHPAMVLASGDHPIFKAFPDLVSDEK
jgi:hypothetical protein